MSRDVEEAIQAFADGKISDAEMLEALDAHRRDTPRHATGDAGVTDVRAEAVARPLRRHA